MFKLLILSLLLTGCTVVYHPDEYIKDHCPTCDRQGDYIYVQNRDTKYGVDVGDRAVLIKYNKEF